VLIVLIFEVVQQTADFVQRPIKKLYLWRYFKSNMSVVILIGFMGCGKTTLGRKLARSLDYAFIDADDAIEKAEGLTIPEIFAQKGEAYFRELEHAFIAGLQQQSNAIVSTGGGMPCFGNNMELLNAAGITIYLQRPVLELAHRLTHARKQRPLIAGKNHEELVHFISELLPIREQYYLQATYILDRESQTVEAIQEVTGILPANPGTVL
jgi:shikimate kinase